MAELCELANLLTNIVLTMPLELTDPRWNELQSSYGDTKDVLAWLANAYAYGISEDGLGDLVNEVQHQGGACTAMYAVAVHLIELASRTTPELALDLLTHAGMIYANSDGPKSVACPDFLKAEFEQFADEGAKRLAPLLTLANDFDRYKWGVAGLAGFLGQKQFARFLDGLDYYQGRFYHQLIDGAFPSEFEGVGCATATANPVKLKHVGFFEELGYADSKGPSLKTSVRPRPDYDREGIMQYLRAGVLLAASPGTVKDILDPSGPIIGAPHLLTDGEWVWPNDLAYYVGKYNVVLPREFVHAIEGRNYMPPIESEMDLGKLEF